MVEFLQEKNAEANFILKADEKLTEADKKMAGKTAPYVAPQLQMFSIRLEFRLLK